MEIYVQLPIFYIYILTQNKIETLSQWTANLHHLSVPWLVEVFETCLRYLANISHQQPIQPVIGERGGTRPNKNWHIWKKLTTHNLFRDSKLSPWLFLKPQNCFPKHACDVITFFSLKSHLKIGLPDVPV